MLRVSLLLAACCAAAAEFTALELNHATFEAEVVNQPSRAAFVMFYDPSCNYCIEARPTFDTLAKDYEGSSTLLIAAVDCMASGGSILCGFFGVDSYPSFRSFSPPHDREGVDYDGDSIGLEYLRNFVATLGPRCSFSARARCSEEQLKEIEELSLLTQAGRDALLEELETKLDAEEYRHEEVRLEMQRKYDESERLLEQLRQKYEDAAFYVKRAAGGPKGIRKDEL